MEPVTKPWTDPISREREERDRRGQDDDYQEWTEENDTKKVLKLLCAIHKKQITNAWF